MSRTTVVVWSFLLLMFIACGTGTQTTTVESNKPQPKPAEPERDTKRDPNAPKVDWDNYHPTVKTRIDELAADGDCEGLQKQFDTAESNNANQRRRTGDGNADLMKYIDYKMKEAGCYD